MAVDYDLIIVGGGVTGAITADHFAARGRSVLVLDSGPGIEPRMDVVGRFLSAWPKTPGSAYQNYPKAPKPSVVGLDKYYVQTVDPTGASATTLGFRSTYERRVGGTTWHWLGTCLRLLPNDFRLRSEYGVGVDWPLTYADLLPWYEQAERVIGVSGDSQQWRRFLEQRGGQWDQDFPMPMVWQTYLDGVITRALDGQTFDGLPMEVTSTPQGRNSQPYDGRPPCAGNTSCIPVCPIHAKFDSTLVMARAVSNGAEVRPKSVVTRIQIDSNGMARGVTYKDWDRNEHRVTARVVILAAHAIESPKILLMSKLADGTRGIANTSDQVGRNLMDHNVTMSYALAKEPTYPFRGPLSTSGVESLRDGPFRAYRGAFRVEIGNEGWNWATTAPYTDVTTAVADGAFGAQLRQRLEHRITRQFRLGSLVEMLPQQTNRIVPDEGQTDELGIPRPKLHFEPGAYCAAGFDAAQKAHQQIFDAVGCSETHPNGDTFYGAGHVIGTLRMGHDPKQSVVDDVQRSHDHPNLFVLGSATFPTCATANPTLTLVALALRSLPAIEEALP